MHKKEIIDALKKAFPYTIPILAGYVFLGFSYGVYSSACGLPIWEPILMSIVVFGGSLQFVSVSVFLSTFAPIQTLLLALMVQARHLFYSIAMLKKYKDTDKKMKWYLIFGLTDETFSVIDSADIPDSINKNWFYFWITFLNQIYWIIGSTLGSILGTNLPFDSTGIDFMLTALFVVICLNQFLKEKTHYSTIIGFITSIVCLLIFGSDNFIIPTMVSILIFLTLFRNKIEKGENL